MNDPNNEAKNEVQTETASSAPTLYKAFWPLLVGFIVGGIFSAYEIRTGQGDQSALRQLQLVLLVFVSLLIGISMLLRSVLGVRYNGRPKALLLFLGYTGFGISIAVMVAGVIAAFAS